MTLRFSPPGGLCSSVSGNSNVLCQCYREKVMYISRTNKACLLSLLSILCAFVLLYAICYDLDHFPFLLCWIHILFVLPSLRYFMSSIWWTYNRRIQPMCVIFVLDEFICQGCKKFIWIHLCSCSHTMKKSSHETIKHTANKRQVDPEWPFSYLKCFLSIEIVWVNLLWLSPGDLAVH